jgi:hypothetical protein
MRPGDSGLGRIRGRWLGGVGRSVRAGWRWSPCIGGRVIRCIGECGWYERRVRRCGGYGDCWSLSNRGGIGDCTSRGRGKCEAGCQGDERHRCIGRGGG